MDAITGSEDMSLWEGAELTKSDRPDLASAKIVVSGGTALFITPSLLIGVD